MRRRFAFKITPVPASAETVSWQTNDPERLEHRVFPEVRSASEKVKLFPSVCDEVLTSSVWVPGV